MSVVEMVLDFKARGAGQAAAAARQIGGAAKEVGAQVGQLRAAQDRAARGMAGGGRAGPAPAALPVQPPPGTRPVTPPAAGGGGLGAGAGRALSFLGLSAGLDSLKRILSSSEEGSEALSALTEAVQPLLDAVGSLAKAFTDAFGPILKTVAELLGGFAKALGWAIQQIGKVVSALNPLPSQSGEARRVAADPNELRRLREAVGKGEGLTMNTGVGAHFLMAAGAKRLLEEIEKAAAGKGNESDARGGGGAGGREDPRETIKRLQEAAFGGDTEKKTLKETEMIRKVLERIKEIFEKPGAPPAPPPLGV